MFDPAAERPPTPLARLRSAIAQVRDRRALRLPAGGGLLLVGLLCLALSAAVWAARPATCIPLRHAEFATIEELIAVKDKVMAYEREPTGELVLSGKEASFVLADNLMFPVWIETRADELYVQAAIPDRDKCLHVEFQGSVAVDGGRARVVPRTLRIGRLDLSALVAGHPVQATPEDLPGEDARRLLGHTRRLRVVGDQVHVEIDDPRSLR